MMKDQNFELMAGDYQILELDVINSAGIPYPDLGSGVLDWCLYHPPHSAIVIHKTSIESDLHYVGIHVPYPGIVLVELLGTESASLESGEYYHKLCWTLAGHVKTAATGVLTIDKDGSEYFKV